jgi:nitrogen fixation protein NifU and related proteins
MYSPQVLDPFEHPRNAGEVAGPDASIQMENPVCGDVLRLTLKLSAGRIGEIRFLAKGSLHGLRFGAHGARLGQNRRGSQEPAQGGAGRQTRGLPPASSHAGHLALDALSAALDQLEHSP